MPAHPDASNPDASVVHLQSLRDFARQLQAQIDAVPRTAGPLLDPSSTALAVGDFPEAAALRERHAKAIAEMRTLLDKVLAALSFAERVTGVVADTYVAADARAVAGYGRIGEA